MKKFSQFQHRLRKKKSSIKNSKHCLIYTTRGEIYKTSDRSELEFDTQTLTSQKNSLREFEPIIWIQKKASGLNPKTLNWWALRGLRKENSPVEDFLTKGEHLLVLRQVTTMPTKRYKWSDRSE